MIDDWINPITVLQVKNAFITLLNFSMVGVFASILVADRDNWRDTYWQACFWIMVYLIGEAAEQFWYWAWRHFANGNPYWLTDWRMLSVIGLNGIIALGGIYIIKVFTAARYGHRLWVAVSGMCFLLALASLALPKHG